jgi:hypothetical protein
MVASNTSGNAADSTVTVYYDTTAISTNTVNAPIHTKSNAKSTASDLMDVSMTILNNNIVLDSAKISYNGFSSSPQYVTVNGNYINATPGSVVDSYAATSNAGNYLEADGIKFTLATPATALSGISSNEPVTVTVNQVQNGSGGASKTDTSTFLYEPVSSAPTINSMSLNLNSAVTGATQISGIWVLTNTADIPIDVSTNVSNLGSYFYNPTQILSYSTGQTETGTTNVTNITGGRLANPTTIVNTSGTITKSYTEDMSGIVQFSLTGTAYNSVGLSGTGTGTMNVVYDISSYALVTNTTLYPTAIPTLSLSSDATLNYGFRVSSETAGTGVLKFVTDLSGMINSGTMHSTTFCSTAYNNATSLLTNQEIQIANGGYCSKTSPNTYLNYANTFYGHGLMNTLDYTGVTDVAGIYRFATYAWRFPSVLAANSAYMQIFLNGVNQTLVPTTTTSKIGNGTGTINIGSASGPELLVYYRVESTDANITSFPTGTITTNYTNSIWINACSTANGVTAGTFYKLNGTYQTSGPLGGRVSSSPPSFSSGTLQLNTNLLSSPTRNYSSNLPVLYVRVGLPNTVPIQYTGVTARLSSTK